MATMSPEKIITLDRVEDFMDLIDIDNSYGYDCNAGIAPKNESVKELLYQVNYYQFWGDMIVFERDSSTSRIRTWRCGWRKKYQLIFTTQTTTEYKIFGFPLMSATLLSIQRKIGVKQIANSWVRISSIFFQFFFKSNYGLLGMHGFDPHSADMHPIFFARGPDFANKKEEQEPFTNLDLYPLCCFLLGIEPAPNNGSLAELHSYLGKILFIYHRKLDVSNCFKCFFYLIPCWQFQVINKIVTFFRARLKKYQISND